MHDIIAFLKEAVSRNVAGNDCYIFDGETVRATNITMHAGIEWKSPARFALPADAVDAFLARTTEVQELKVEATHVVFRSGRLSSRINRYLEDPQPMPDMPEEWQRSPPGLTSALKMAQNFLGEGSGGRIWVTAVRLWGDRVTASSGQIMIDIDVPGLDMDDPRLLPQGTVAFLIAQGDPDEYGTDDNSITFRWEDGRWMRTRLIDAEMPEDSVRKILDEMVGDEAPVEITDEWRAALADAVALGDGAMELTAAGIKSANKSHVTNIDLAVDVSVDHLSRWGTKNLAAVAAVATHWNPGAYPSIPSLFRGDGVKGAIVGIQK